MSNLRERIWGWARRGIPHGALLPKWAVRLRFVLFPLNTLLWRIANTQGYDPATDLWTVGGIRFTASFIRSLARPGTRIVRVDRFGDTMAVTEGRTLSSRVDFPFHRPDWLPAKVTLDGKEMADVFFADEILGLVLSYAKDSDGQYLATAQGGVAANCDFGTVKVQVNAEWN